jgi:hypothetical protein
MANGNGEREGETTRRVTNDDIGRRIGHLETVQEEHGTRLHELGNLLGVVQLKVEHAQEMIRVRFTGLESAIATNTAKLDALLEQRVNDGADPSATPAGRALLARVEASEKWQRDHEPTLQTARSIVVGWRVLAGGSVLTALVGIVSLLISFGVLRGPT